MTICDREEEVKEHVASHFKKISIHMKPKIESDVYLSVVMDVF